MSNEKRGKRLRNLLEEVVAITLLLWELARNYLSILKMKKYLVWTLSYFHTSKSITKCNLTSISLSVSITFYYKLVGKPLKSHFKIVYNIFLWKTCKEIERETV